MMIGRCRNVENVKLEITGIPSTNIKLQEYRIDKDHSNSYEVWKRMGSPQQPTKEQIAELEKAGQLDQTLVKNQKLNKGLLQLDVTLSRQGIVFYKIQW